MKRIIINADDYGLNEHISRAIAEAFTERLITDTTMMATGDYFDEAVKTARKQGFLDRIGIHLNLTEGVPLTEGILSQTRFVTDGRFNKRYDLSSPLTASEETAIEAELTAQVERLRAAGIAITHADSHHHVHLGRYIAPVAMCVMKRYEIKKIRRSRERKQLSPVDIMMIEVSRAWLSEGFLMTDHFAYAADVTSREIPANTELLIHPDYDRDGRLIDRRGVSDGYPVGNPFPDIALWDGIELSDYTRL